MALIHIRVIFAVSSEDDDAVRNNDDKILEYAMGEPLTSGFVDL